MPEDQLGLCDRRAAIFDRDVRVEQAVKFAVASHERKQSHPVLFFVHRRNNPAGSSPGPLGWLDVEA